MLSDFSDRKICDIHTVMVSFFLKKYIMEREEKIKEDEIKQNEAWSEYYRRRSIRARELRRFEAIQDYIDRCEILIDEHETRYPFEPPHGYY